jgi:hypothetical protein
VLKHHGSGVPCTPGTHGTITGTAINEWLDDEGNPKFGDPDEHPFGEDRDESDSDESK